MVHEMRLPRARLGLKEMDGLLNDKITHLAREQLEINLQFAGFLILHCPLKEVVVGVLEGLADSSHRVREFPSSNNCNSFIPPPCYVS